MSALSSLLRAFTVLAVLAPSLGASATEEDLSQVGIIEKVENEAAIVVASAARPAVVGMAVHLKDELRTGAQGRMLVVFRDDTELTLGEKASVVIDRYVYDPDKGIGETLSADDQGRLPLRTGRIEELKREDHRNLYRLRRYRACAAPSSGADRSTRNMVCCCSKERSPSRTRPDA